MPQRQPVALFTHEPPTLSLLPAFFSLAGRLTGQPVHWEVSPLLADTLELSTSGSPGLVATGLYALARESGDEALCAFVSGALAPAARQKFATLLWRGLCTPVVSLLLERDGEHLYLHQRTGTERLRGYFASPGGRLKRLESPRQAALRELAEETGLRVAPHRLGLYRLSFESAEDTSYLCYTYRLALREEEVPLNQQPSLHGDFQLFSRPEARRLRLLPSLERILQDERQEEEARAVAAYAQDFAAAHWPSEGAFLW